MRQGVITAIITLLCGFIAYAICFGGGMTGAGDVSTILTVSIAAGLIVFFNRKQ